MKTLKIIVVRFEPLIWLATYIAVGGAAIIAIAWAFPYFVIGLNNIWHWYYGF